MEDGCVENDRMEDGCVENDRLEIAELSNSLSPAQLIEREVIAVHPVAVLPLLAPALRLAAATTSRAISLGMVTTPFASAWIMSPGFTSTPLMRTGTCASRKPKLPCAGTMPGEK